MRSLIWIFFIFYFVSNLTFQDHNNYDFNYPNVCSKGDILLINEDPKSILINDIFPKSVHYNLIKEYKYLEKFRQNRLLLKNDIIHSDKLVNNDAVITRITQSYNFSNQVSRILEERVTVTNIKHPYSNFIQISDQPYNRLDWHYDLNFYQGDIYVGVYTLINKGNNASYSSQLHCQQFKNKTKCFNTPENSFLIFRADQVRHRVLPLKHNESRVVFQTLFTNSKQQTLIDKIRMYLLTSEGSHLFFNAKFKSVER